ncbi:MAG TPA: lipocalin family protein [Thermoanaerobaculia bacterium]|nr:lipocalin family protein [Thermoanaerobaculia bacterium]
MRRSLATALALAALSSLALAARFRTPASGPAEFPRDHGAHDDARLEWWYVTGHLFGTSGRSGYELTFFRAGASDEPKGARASDLAARDLFLAHFARSDLAGARFAFSERTHRGGVSAAWAREGRLDVANEEWRLVDLGGSFALFASEGAGDAREELSLLLTPEKPAVLHGADGLSRKGREPDAVSKYVSLTRLKTTGWRTSRGVTEPVTGLSWFDHEWGPGALGAGIAGWDWFALQLADGRDLMVYRLRRKDGSAAPESSGTLVERSGTSRPLPLSDVTIQETARWTSPRSKATYPARWSLSVPSAGLALDVVPLLSDQELATERSTGVTYWEGACDVRDAKGLPAGSAYVELTGYGSRALGRLSR